MRIMNILALLAGATSQAADPPFSYRCLYAPAHFGNSYEVMGEREMRDMLREAKHWGFNHYGDWFDTIDCADPFADPHYNLGGALWDRKKANFRSAQELGLSCDLIITPNHVFLDQRRPPLLAVQGGRLFGQLICPSKPEARKIILQNYKNLLSDLAKSGVRLSSLCAAPYDYGGCACEQCKPWILTFARLCREIHAVAEEYHPDIQMRFVGWWWSKEEHIQFAEWADAEAPGWVKSIALHIQYGQTDVADAPLPKGCERHAFVHIGYADQATPRDTYGHLGPVIAPTRLPSTVAALKSHDVAGYMAYSEGIYEDVNKAILGGLSSAKFYDVDQILRAYAVRYFNADEEQAANWAAWLKQWGRPFDVDAAKAGAEIRRLAGDRLARHWRVRQWMLKAELLRLHAKIMAQKEWTPERLADADAFWAARERLERQVYGLGPVRHILAKRFAPLPWRESWAKLMAQRARRMEDDM